MKTTKTQEVSFVQMADGTVYHAYDFPLCRTRSLNTMTTKTQTVSFVQMADGTVYHAYDFPLCRTRSLNTKPTGKGMTDEQVRDAWDAHLRHLGHEDGE